MCRHGEQFDPQIDLRRTHEIYVNVCMNSFVIDVEALWSTVDLNKNEYPKYKSNVEGVLYLHFRDDWSFIHGILKGLFWPENSLRTMHTAKCHRIPRRSAVCTGL